MIPLIVLIVTFAVLRLTGALGWAVFDSWHASLRGALAAMFCLTASDHWGKRRPDLVRMVPPRFPRPELLVTLTGVLEILGAIGLLIPATAKLAALCLALLLTAIFPANIHAARQQLTIGGRPVPAMPLRTALQIVFLAALLAVAWRG